MGYRQSRVHEEALTRLLHRMANDGWRVWRWTRRDVGALAIRDGRVLAVRVDGYPFWSWRDEATVAQHYGDEPFDEETLVKPPFAAHVPERGEETRRALTVEVERLRAHGWRVIDLVVRGPSGRIGCKMPDGVAFKDGRILALEALSWDGGRPGEKMAAYAMFDGVEFQRFKNGTVLGEPELRPRKAPTTRRPRVSGGPLIPAPPLTSEQLLLLRRLDARRRREVRP